MKDAICIYSDFYSSKNKKYNYEYNKKILDDYNEILEEAVNESEEQKLFALEDSISK